MLSPRFAALILTALLYAHSVPADPVLAVEAEPVLDAAALVQPALLSGPGFNVEPRVEIRGYMARFRLETPYGPLRADSVEILAEREAELPALEALDRVTRSEAFLRAAGDRFAATAGSLAQIALHPVDTLLGIPAGVARYFGGRVKKIGNQAQNLSDRTARQFGTEGDAYPDDSGPMNDPGAGGAAEPRPEKRWYTPIAKEATREVKRRVKYGQVKRELAARLGVDPYTSNPLIQERLSGLAWVGSGGNFGADAALGAVGGVGATVLSTGGQINDVVWKLAPEDLRERNRGRLETHCRDTFLIRQFLRRGVFSPTLQTSLADALDALRPTEGCDALLELGMTADSPLEARFLVNALRILTAHQGARSGGGRLQPIGAGLAYLTAGGELVLPLPVDYLSWTEEVRDFLDRANFRVVEKTVLIGGQASLATRRGLTERGWNIRQHAPWPGGPPYARSGEPDEVDVEG
ncbi:MAG: hypothetical protein J0H15_12475 [Xanthomonadales bacterium]|nr:hypothetical protein [Xanthomonadales bacterium]